MLICYFLLVIVYFLFGYLFLPDEICATGWYFAGSLLFPFLAFGVLVLVYTILLLLGGHSLSDISGKKMPVSPSVDDHDANNFIEYSEAKVDPPIDDEIEPEVSVPYIHRQSTADEMLRSVDLLDGPGFERWCARLLEKDGFSDIQLTKSSGDQGVDIVASKDDVWYAIQCKCYSSDLGNHPVQEVHAGKRMYNCHVGIVMTNRYFTSGAKDLAKATGTLLWDRDKLKVMLQEIQQEK